MFLPLENYWNKLRKGLMNEHLPTGNFLSTFVGGNGAKHVKGNEQTGVMQPVSMLLRFYGTDNKAIAEAVGAKKFAMAKRADYPEEIPVYFNGNFGLGMTLCWSRGFFRIGITKCSLIRFGRISSM